MVASRPPARWPSRLRGVLVPWAAAWPTITILLVVLEGPVGHWPLPLRTLLLTGLMVPTMGLALVPALDHVLDVILRGGMALRTRGTSPQGPEDGSIMGCQNPTSSHRREP